MTCTRPQAKHQNPLATRASSTHDHPRLRYRSRARARYRLIFFFLRCSSLACRQRRGGGQTGLRPRQDGGAAFIFEPVALACYLHDGGVMEDAVEHGRRQHSIAGEGVSLAAKLADELGSVIFHSYLRVTFAGVWKTLYAEEFSFPGARSRLEVAG